MKQDWKKVRLGEVTYIADYVANGSFASLRENVTYKDKKDFAILVRLADFSAGWNGNYIYVDEHAYNFLAKSSLKENDIVMCNVGSVGKCFKVPELGMPMTLAPNSILIRSNTEELNQDYLYYCLTSDSFLNKLQEICHMVAQPKFNKTDLKKIEIPLPPLATQTRIVHQLDLLTRLTTLKAQQLTHLHHLAHSTFHHLFVEPQEILRSSLPQDDAATRHSEQSEESPAQVRHCEAGATPAVAISTPSPWPVKKLGDLCIGKPTYGAGASAEPYEEGKPRYIRITDIDDDGNLNDNKVTATVEDESKYLLHDGDILFARSGATVGKTYLYKEKDGRAIYAGYLIRFVPDQSVILPEYLFAFTHMPEYKDWISRQQNAVAQPNINAKQYSELEIPVPPIQLQKTFAQQITRLHRLATTIHTTQTHLHHLLQTTLHHHFG